MTQRPEPFALSVPDEAIEDLRERLAKTRFPDQTPGVPWTFGTEVSWLKELVAYWHDEFDWRAAEARLNAFPQYTVPVSGIDVHFLHVTGRGPDPMPLLLSHGWPGSVFEFLDLIPRLTDPLRFGGSAADAVTVVAPSLPGYGLSFRPGQKRFSVAEMAGCFATLMTDVLGYERYAVQGGDWGSFISTRIALEVPKRVVGLHVNMMPLPRDPSALTDATPEERTWREELEEFLKIETGYQWIQGTRPQTLAYGLTDSPAGLAAWIGEKFAIWTDSDGDLFSVISKDDLLANVSLYWFTGAIGSSFWPYVARLQGPWPIPSDRTIDVPVGYAAFPKEILRPPRSLAARTYTDIRQWTPMEKGGHFAAMEQPDALAHDILQFLRRLRRSD